MTAENANLYATLQGRFHQAPDRPCLESPGTDTLRYAELDAGSARIANLFLSLGLEAGDRVLVKVAKSPLAVLVYLACLRSGLIFVPLNPAGTRDELAYFLTDAEPALLILDPAESDIPNRYESKHTLTIDASGNGTVKTRMTEFPVSHDVVSSQADDIAVLIYTSGTTGSPKGAMLSHGNLLSNARTLYDCWGWRSDDVLLHALPIFHVHGLFVALHLALLGTSRMIFLPAFDADAVIKYLPAASVYMGVPTHYTRLLHSDALNRDLCGHMRLFISGSAPLLAETFQAFRTRTGHTILERYGMSETGMLTSNPLDGKRLAGTVGYPLPGVTSRICDEHGKPVAQGDIGLFQVKGRNVFQGYWGKPGLAETEFQDGYFITGDLVSESEDGRITIVGRNKDMIISGGLNVYPREIEQVLDEQPGVRESAVFGVPHPDFGEGVVAAVVPEPGANPDAGALIDACRRQLAPYKIPKAVEMLNELPRNTMGKVQKNRLREIFNAFFTM